MNEHEALIHRLFDRSVAAYPEKTAVQIKQDGQWRRFSYRRLQETAYATARFLREEKCLKQDRAVLILENLPEWMGIYLGMMYAGVVCVPLDPQSGAQEVPACIKDSQARIIFCSAQIFTEKVSPWLKSFPLRVVIVGAQGAPQNGNIDFGSLLKKGAGDRPDHVDISSDDTASLIYTSGTTDRPKGVLLSHKNICANAESIRQLHIIRRDDILLALLPLHHTYPFMVACILPLSIGACVTCVPRGFKPQELSAIMREAGITIFVGVPQLFSLLHAGIGQKIKSIPPVIRSLILPFARRKVRTELGGRLRLFASGGARLDPAIARELPAWTGVRLIEGYGLTETSPVVTFNPQRRVKIGSVGKPIPGVRIMIRNPNERGEGEILVRGDNVMKGYYKNDALTAEVIEDGWLHTGDLGYIDRDGYLFITGREKEVIVLPSGKNIYPEELESFYGHSPYIKEICVVDKSTGSGGEMLFAVILPDFEYFRQKNETAVKQRISRELEVLAKGLPPYKHIMGFMLVREELPRTTLKKLQRYEVRRRYLDTQSTDEEVETLVLTDEDKKLLELESTRRIIAAISQRLKKQVTLASHLEIDLGIDSLTRVEIGLELEKLFGIHIPDDVLYSVVTVRDVAMQIDAIIRNPPAYPD